MTTQTPQIASYGMTDRNRVYLIDKSKITVEGTNERIDTSRLEKIASRDGTFGSHVDNCMDTARRLKEREADLIGQAPSGTQVVVIGSVVNIFDTQEKVEVIADYYRIKQ